MFISCCTSLCLLNFPHVSLLSLLFPLVTAQTTLSFTSMHIISSFFFCIPKAHICGMACLWVAETVDVFKGKAQISPFLTWPLIDFFLAYSFYVILTSYFCFLIYQFIYCCSYPLPLAFTTLSAFILLVFPTLFTSLIRSFSFVCF